MSITQNGAMKHLDLVSQRELVSYKKSEEQNYEYRIARIRKFIGESWR